MEGKPMADQFIELWPNLTRAMEFWRKLCKFEQPGNKLNEHLKSVLQDPLITAKLEFFSYFVEMLNPS